MIDTKYIWSKFKYVFDKNPSYINVRRYVNLDLKPLYKIPGYLMMEQTAQVSSFYLQKSFICVAYYV